MLDGMEMISSKELIETAGISRATLNNYVGFGLLPRPIVTKSRSEDGNASRLGYFPDSALDTVQKIKNLKRDGQSMTEIVAQLKNN
jgi:adenylate cyclase